MKNKRPDKEQFQRDLQAVIDEVDPRQMEIFDRMSTAEKGRRLSDMIGGMRRLAFETERHMNPELSEKEIHKRALSRFMRFSEWEPELLERFLVYLDRRLDDLYD